MRHSRRLDWALLVSLVSVYLVMLAGGIGAHLSAGQNTLPVRLTNAQGAAGYPLVLSLRGPAAGVQRDDSVVRLGDFDLRGLSRAQIEYRTRSLLRDGTPFEIAIERGGERSILRIEPTPYRSWWWTVPVWALFVLVGGFLLLRAPHWHLRRHFFIAGIAWGCFGAGYYLPVHPVQVAAFIASEGIVAGLSVWYVRAWDVSHPPGRGTFVLSWGIGLATIASMVASYLWAAPAGSLPYTLAAIDAAAFVLLYVVAMLRAYRRSEPLERRQLRWIAYAHCVAGLPMMVLLGYREVSPALSPEVFSLGFLFTAAIPLGYAVAVVGYNWLDIDRVISASAAATAVAIVALGALFAAVPAAAESASNGLGIDPSTSRTVLSMALAAIFLPAYQGLRPWIDRRLFAAHFDLTEGFARLRTELGTCDGVEALVTRAGEGIDVLVRPESVAIYARAGESFAPLFVRGRGAPPAFEMKDLLVGVLETKGQLLLSRGAHLAPFERAALDTLGAEVVMPQMHAGQLLAFICLGGKRTGDIYTASEVSLLASVAERCTDVIARLDAETLTRDAQAMQSALRRYVPEAVAERVLAGGDMLDPRECEVCVLFVDIRGYTHFAESREASDVFATINEHTERVSKIVQDFGGTVVEFHGDGMMTVFGAPEPLPKKERLAVEAARSVVDSMPADLSVGVGIATGPAYVGSIRSTDRLIWSALGSTVNLAARLEALTRELEASIAVDALTQERAGYVCADFARHESVAIRGRSRRFEVFTLPLADKSREM